MAAAVHVRHRRSVAMQAAWHRKKELLAKQKRARMCEIDQIHADLLILPSSTRVKTDAEMYYETFGIVKRLSSVYRTKRLGALHSAGILHMGGDANSFLRVARVDMSDPDTLTHTERLFVLRHNVAWENYLFNHTNFAEALLLVADVIVDISHIEFLFPLPSHWPWVRAHRVPPVQRFMADELPDMFEHWVADHEHLYDNQ
jgi:hypothetical protein